MFKLIRQSVLSTLCLAVLLCAAYPLLVTGVANAFFPKEAAGSLILRDGAIVGSAIVKLLAQHGKDAPEHVGAYAKNMKDSLR